MNRRLMCATLLVTAGCAIQAANAETWDAYSGFHAADNVATARWQYMYTATAGQNADYQLLDAYSSSQGWYRSSDTYSLPFVKTDNGEVQIHPGGNANWEAASVLAWKNLNANTETVNVSFSLADRDSSAYQFSDGIEYWLYSTTSSDFLKHGFMDNGGATGTITTDTPVSVAGGGMLYLQIGPRAYIDCDMTGVTFSVTSVPEPTSLIMLLAGVFGLLAYAWRKRK